MNPVQFLKEVRRELKKVSWPTRAEVVQMTTLVVVVSFAVGIYIGVLDLTLTNITAAIIK